VRSGYAFAGWNTRADGSGSGFAASTAVNAALTVYAQWTELAPDSYTVTFKGNDGTEESWAVKTVTAPATAIGAADFPEDPARSGYAFAGWNTEANGSGSGFAASTTVSAALTVYAQWTELVPGSHTVTFKRNDGTETTWAVKTVTTPATAIGAANFPADPERSGYAFAGWNTRADGSGSAFAASTAVNAALTVYAQWTAVASTVTFRRNDGTETDWAVKTVTAPATAIGAADFPADPARSGYAFAGWNTRADGSGSGFAASTAVNADIRVYAQWTAVAPGSHTVTFKRNDGTETTWAVKTVTAPATAIGAANFPVNPARSGYAFAGWNTGANGSGSAFAASTVVNAALTVYAQWTALAYTVTFKRNDGTNADWAVKTVTAPATTLGAVNFPANPARSGYAFAGWNTGANGSGSAFAASTAVNAALTVYAQWTAVAPSSYTVTFKLNDGTDAIWAVKTVTAPSTTLGAANFPSDPSWSGYTFAGWSTRNDWLGSGFTSSIVVNRDITVYALWNYNTTYTVTFKKNAGADADWAVKTVTAPATAIRAANFPANPSRQGFGFAGWNTNEDGSGSAFDVTTTVNSNITVYAQWNPGVFSVIFMTNDGTDLRHETGTVTDPATTVTDLPDNPERIGYTFKEWNTQADGFGSAFDDTTTVDTDMTVYAQWEANTYTALFKSNYGTNETLDTKTVTVPATTIANFPGDPTRSDYVFRGWNTKADGTGNAFDAAATVDSDIEVYAQWAAIYTVSFMLNDGTNATLPAKTVIEPATAIADFPGDPARSGYTFTGWNTEANGTGSAFDAAATVNSNITVYAQWEFVPFDIILNLDIGDGAFSQTDFVLSKGANDSQTVSVTGLGYENPRWFVDGGLKKTGNSITIRAIEYSLGKHTISLIISKDGFSWSREIRFTINN
jgi:uncharacterized repeat protein (TIGR02543 family)